MADWITSVGSHKQFPYLKSLGCPGCHGTCGSGNKATPGPQLAYRNPDPPLKRSVVQIGTGDRAIAVTIAYMMRGAMGPEGVSNPEIRRRALTIVKSVPGRNQDGEISAILQWVKANIAFRGEYGETVQSPLVTLQLGAGDCDCISTLMAALLGSLGYQTRFRTVAADASDPQQFTHVYLEVLKRRTGQWVPLDATVPQSYPGWAPGSPGTQPIYRSKAWPGMGDTFSPAAASSGANLSPNQQLFQNLIMPLDQAVASRISTGGGPRNSANFNAPGISASGNISPTALALGGGLLALGLVVAISRSGRRSE